MTETLPETAPAAPPKTTTTAADWSARGIHTITLVSGAVVKIRIPDLSVLLAGDAVPEELRAVAFDEVRKALRQEATHGPNLIEAIDDRSDDANAERLRGLRDLNLFLVANTLVEPAMTEQEVREGNLPTEDLAMLTQIASRQRTVDAVGVQIGVEPLDRWDLWRQAHECAEDCVACASVIRELSSVDLA